MTNDHDQFCSLIVNYVRNNFSHNWLDVISDVSDGPNPGIIEVNNEFKTGKCIPDLIAENRAISPNLYILGEAKTYKDYHQRELDRENQLEVMINFLKKYKNAYLIYSLPNQLTRKVENNIKEKIKKFDAYNIQFIVLDEMTR